MFNDRPDSRVAVRYWLLSALALAVLIGYWAATIVNVSESLLNLAFTVVIVSVLISAGVWIADTIAVMQKAQDCALQGRQNCAPIEVPVTKK